MTLTGHTTRLLLAAAMAALGAAALTGCRGERSDKPPHQLFPDMDDQPRFKAQRETEFFVDGRTMRPKVDGTVAWGRSPIDVESETIAGTSWAGEYRVQRARLLKDDDAVYLGETGAGGEEADPDRWLESIPVTVDRELIELGRKNFDIYCATCHGYEGDGQGMVGQRWAGQIVANYHDEKYKDPTQFTGRDGYVFYVGRNGLYDEAGTLRMPGFKQALNEEEMWGVVAYIRTLQASRVPIESELVPESERQRLVRAEPALARPRVAEEPTEPESQTAAMDADTADAGDTGGVQ